MRICSAYGAGFYYIPGTDVCLRVGGYTFTEFGWNARNAAVIDQAAFNPSFATPAPSLIVNRNTNLNTFRVKGVVILDARWQSPLGTARTYLALGMDYISPANGGMTFGTAQAAGPIFPYFERAFIQVAGFTVGYVESFFNPGGWWHTWGLHASLWKWNPAVAYTAQFGNGFSATLSVEDRQAHETNINAAGYINTSALVNSYGGQTFPDIIANLRIDQAWGFVQVAGMLHQLRVNQALATAGIADAWGHAFSFGADIKLPMLAPGDSIFFQAAYARGVVGSTGLGASPLTEPTAIGIRNNFGIGPVSQIYDALATTTLLQSRAYSAGVMFRHYIQPNLWAGIGVNYNRYEPGGHDNVLISASPVLRITQAFGKILWNPIRNLDVGVDVLYTKLQANDCPGAAAALRAASCNVARDIWSGWMRIRQNF